MNTKSEIASAEQEFSLALQFLGRLHAGQFPADAVQLAKDDPEHPIWAMLETLSPKQVPVIPAKPITTSIKASDTDLFSQLSKAEAFTKEYFGVSVKLAEIFQIPETVPWESVLPVFVPAGFNNRKGFELLQKLGLNSWEETDVMRHSDSSASDKHQLFLIQNSERPDKDTMEMSPNQLRKTGNLFLNLKGYAIAMGLYHQSTKGYLDSKETFTWFPENRLSSGEVACGKWNPGDRRVGFYCSNPDYENDYGGARLAISVSLET